MHAHKAVLRQADAPPRRRLQLRGTMQGESTGSAEPASNPGRPLRLFAISDLHTDYAQNMCAPAGAERASVSAER